MTRFFTPLFLILITISGALLRFVNITPFKIYPDSYQSLIVANNIAHYKSVVGFLGDNGSLYPPFFMWTRPLYPLLINSLNFFINNPTLAAQIIAFTLSVACIPLAFVLIKRTFKSNTSGLAASSLVALSFHFNVWSGFIMTESTGVFFMLVFLFFLLRDAGKKEKLLNTHDLISGSFFALAILARYEYALLAAPIILLFVVQNKKPLTRLATLFTSTILVLLFVFLTLFPVDSTLDIALSQLKELPVVAAIFLLSIGVIAILKKTLSKYLHGTALLIFFVIIAATPFFSTLTLFKVFFEKDILFAVLVPLGFLLFWGTKYEGLRVFIILSTLAFGLLYWRINHEMERYIVHLIPFFIFPAAYAFEQILKTRGTIKIAIFSFGVTLIALQTQFTYFGLRNRDNGAWTKVSYEEKSASTIQENYNVNDLLITSFPEPYFYFTNKSTHSISDQLPFIYMDKSLDDKTVLLIEDEGMRDIFPNFTKFIDQRLNDKKVGDFFVGVPYHYEDRIENEKKPVVVYRMKLSDLKLRVAALQNF